MTKPLTRLDLNLLLTLQLLLQERSVSKAAKKLNVTGSTVSKSLAKLRDWFGDPLFVKTPQGFSPTPLALSMEPELIEWQQRGQQLAALRSESIPRNAVFNLAMESPLSLIMFNQLAQQIRRHYPDAKVKLTQWEYDSVDAIIRGDIDIGFTGRESHPRSKESLNLLPDVIEHTTVFVDQPRVYLHQDHPALRHPWTLDAFLHYPHIAIEWEKQETWALDDVLADLGRPRATPMVMASFEQSLFMAAQPDHRMLTTAPGYCRSFARQLLPELVSLPIPLPDTDQKKLQIPFTLLWHKRNRHNPKVRWLRDTLATLYADS